MGCSPTEQILLQGSKDIKTHIYEFAKRLAVFPSESFSQVLLSLTSVSKGTYPAISTKESIKVSIVL